MIRRPANAAVLIVAYALAVTQAPASTLQLIWSASQTILPTGGSGTWNLTNSHWTPSGPVNYQQWVNDGTAEAIFGASAGTVTFGADITTAGIDFAADGYTLNGNGHTLTFSNASGSTPFITVESGNTATVNASLSYTGRLNVNGPGTLMLGGGGSIGHLDLDGGGATTVNGGTLALNNPTSLTIESSQLTISNGAAVTAAGTTTLNSTLSAITINGGSLTTNGLSSSVASSINLQADPTGGAALTINGSGQTYSGSIQGAGSMVIASGSQTLSGTNASFTGNTTVNGGSLTLGTGHELLNSTVAINVDNGLNLNGLASATVGGLTGTGALNLGATALTLNGTSTAAYSGSFSGTGTVTLAGGTQTLSGGGSLTAVNVQQGALTVNGGTTNLTATSGYGLFVGTSVGNAASPARLTIDNGAVVNGSGDVGVNGH